MKNQSLYILLSILLISLGCTDNNESNLSDHPTLIFGSSHGFCQGNCTHLFKYENGEVFRDEMDRFDLSNLVFSDSSDPDITSAAQNVLNNIPEELKLSDQETYGCPDCADQGTLFIQLTEDENTRQWYLDCLLYTSDAADD